MFIQVKTPNKLTANHRKKHMKPKNARINASLSKVALP